MIFGANLCHHSFGTVETVRRIFVGQFDAGDAQGPRVRFHIVGYVHLAKLVGERDFGRHPIGRLFKRVGALIGREAIALLGCQAKIAQLYVALTGHENVGRSHVMMHEFELLMQVDQSAKNLVDHEMDLIDTHRFVGVEHELVERSARAKLSKHLIKKK